MPLLELEETMSDTEKSPEEFRQQSGHGGRVLKKNGSDPEAPGKKALKVEGVRQKPTAKDKKAWKTVDDYDPMFQIMLKGMANLFQRMAYLEAVCYDVIIVKTDSPIVQAISAQGKRYSKKCRKEGRGHTNGPPHPWLWGAFIKTLSEMGVSIGERNLQIIQKHKDEFAEFELEEKCEVIRHFRMEKTYKPETKRLVMSVEKLGETRKAIIDALKQKGAILKQGRAPPGAFEDQLQSWLMAFPKQKA